MKIDCILIFFTAFFGIIYAASEHTVTGCPKKDALLENMIPYFGNKHRQCFYDQHRQCFYDQVKECFTKQNSCFLQTINETKSFEWDPAINVQYTKSFINNFKKCATQEILDRIPQSNEKVGLLENAPNKTATITVSSGSEIKLKHQTCVVNTIQMCIKRIPCYLPFPYPNIVSNIVNTCTNQILTNFGVSLEDDKE
uniref:DUF19 domain-containing protein n=1 Tax=Panagrolaimus sp. ES5 TaxID=591445 RepID=A0AC34FRM5_9BILA